MVPFLPLLSCESSVSVKENPHRKKRSNQNPSFFPLEGAVSIFSHHFHPPYCNAWWGSRTNFPLSQETDFCLDLVTNTKYIIFYRFWTVNRKSIEYPGFTNYFEKTNKKCMPWSNKTWLDILRLTVNQQ